jgi:hypothetical protein
MGPVKEKWSVEYALPLDETEIRPVEEWEGEHSIDTFVDHRRGTAALWTALAVLAVALAVAVAYGYSVISKQNAQLTWVSGRMSSLGAMHGRVESLETLLNRAEVRQAMLAARVQNVDSDWRSGLDEVRLHSAGLVANARQSMDRDLNQRTAALNSKIGGITDRQHAQLEHIAQLESQLANTQRELSSAKAEYTSNLAALRQQQISNLQQIYSLNNALSTDQVDFEAGKNQDAEIAHGVALHLTGTDRAHQKFRGWIQIEGGRRTIWVRNHPAELPVVFYPKAGGEAYELVVTKVNQDAVAGYLLVPGENGSLQQDVASNSKPNPTSAPEAF